MNFRKIQNVLAAVAIIGAFGALIFQSQLEDWWKRRVFSQDKRPTIGRVESINGSVKVRQKDSMTTIGLKPGLSLHSEDTVLTEENETATISFNSGLKVEIEPHSTVVITDSGSEMFFLKGHIKILNEVPGISLPPEAITAALKDEKAPEGAPQVFEPEVTRGPPVPNRKVDIKLSLPDDYIRSVIRNQNTFLSKCYAQHLQNDPDTQGRIETSLIIEKDGTVSTARVIGSTISDPQLQQCIVSILQRAKFKSFAGDPIVVNYPITFD